MCFLPAVRGFSMKANVCWLTTFQGHGFPAVAMVQNESSAFSSEKSSSFVKISNDPDGV